MSGAAEVRLWGSRIGAVAINPGARFAAFEYAPEFVNSGIQLSPIHMPLATRSYTFPSLRFESFHGLPGLLADSLPDKFGSALVDAWLDARGIDKAAFGPIERLSYIGTRGMGALEFHPVSGPRDVQGDIALDVLVELAAEVLTEREAFVASLGKSHIDTSMRRILQIGTSAGGARAKGIVAWNPSTREIRSGQVDADSGFEHWIIKLDGVTGNRDRELADPGGFCAIEFAYALMARAAGIEMSECRLLEENGRRHFMTKRFDRTDDGDKLHMQSLAALAHLDLNMARTNAYEQAFATMQRLQLPAAQRVQQFRRMVFNVIARNQDDHVKNIAYLMNRRGEWSLSPAFDVTYAFNPSGQWTGKHQMSINGKFDEFTLEDLRSCARSASISRGAADEAITSVVDAVRDWENFAAQAALSDRDVERIRAAHRLELPSK